MQGSSIHNNKLVKYLKAFNVVLIITSVHSHQHIIVEADIGGRLIKRYKYTYAQMYKYASTHVRLSLLFCVSFTYHHNNYRCLAVYLLEDPIKGSVVLRELISIHSIVAYLNVQNSVNSNIL